MSESILIAWIHFLRGFHSSKVMAQWKNSAFNIIYLHGLKELRILVPGDVHNGFYGAFYAAWVEPLIFCLARTSVLTAVTIVATVDFVH
jgi:hypothetical protein